MSDNGESADAFVRSMVREIEVLDERVRALRKVIDDAQAERRELVVQRVQLDRMVRASMPRKARRRA
jgi:regulator of sigma D